MPKPQVYAENHSENDTKTIPQENNSSAHIPSSQKINSQTVKDFFLFLNPDPTEIFTVAFLFDRSLPNQPKGNVPGFGTYHGKATQIIHTLKKLHSEFGANVSLHVTLNRTNLLGRKSSNIESTRVLAVDLDGVEQEVLDLVLHFSPNAAIQSSEDGTGKFHLYWKLSSTPGETLTLPEWRKYQLSIAYKFKGDLNLDHITKTLRVPGVPRITKSGAEFTPTFSILSGSAGIGAEVEPGDKGDGYTRAELSTLFPFVDISYEAAKEARKQSFQTIQKLISTAKKEGFNKKSLQEIAASGRNNVLYWSVKREIAVFKPGQNNSFHDFELARAFGKGVNEAFSVPLDEAEFESTVKSAYEHGIKLWEFRRNKYMESLGKLDIGTETQQVLAAANGHMNGVNGAGAGEFSYDFSDPWLAGNSFTDFGLTSRIYQRFSKYLVRSQGTLVAFNEDTKTWRIQTRDKCPELQSFYGQIVYELREDRAFHERYCTVVDEAGNRRFSQDALSKALDRFESAKKFGGVSRLCFDSQRAPEMKDSDFDAKDNVLYVSNGALDLMTGHIREVLATDYLRAKAEVLYDPRATCQGWNTFLDQVFEGNRYIIDFLQEVFGYSLTGSIQAQTLFCHLGSGSNGKSKVLSAIAKLMGEYATYTDPDDIVSSSKRGSVRAFERVGAKIERKRVVIIDDLEIADTWSEGTVKALTSNKIRARAEHEKSREVVNRAKVHVGLNVAPRPQSENYGLLRRLTFIPYEVKFEPNPDESDRIDRMIETELSGILNWAIAGFRSFKQRGRFDTPRQCAAVSEAYREENFSSESKLRELFELSDDGEFMTLQELADIYNADMPMFERLHPNALGKKIKDLFGVSSSLKKEGGIVVRGHKIFLRK